MKVLFRKIDESARLPEYAHPGDAGMDVFAIDESVIPPGGRVLVHTGLAMELPDGYEAQVRSRSGLALKHGIAVLNSPGTIDAGYRGEVGVILINHGTGAFKVEKGMKVAQIVIAAAIRAEIAEVAETGGSERGSGGFGSTGV